MPSSARPFNSNTQKGAWGESIAAAWLIANGYEVYIGLGCASCDIIADKSGKLYRVEVKAASTRNDGVDRYQIGSVNPDKFDMLLVVMPDGSVVQSIDIAVISKSGSVCFVWPDCALTLNGG